MPHAVPVDERVRRDEAGDEHGEHDPAPLRPAARLPHEHDPAAYECDPDDLARRRPEAEECDRSPEHQHRREAARDRVHDRQIGPFVRLHEHDDVADLERRRDDDERPRLRLDAPCCGGHGREQQHPARKRRRSRSLDVVRPREDQIPECVQRGRAERKSERVERHAATLTPPGARLDPGHASLRHAHRLRQPRYGRGPGNCEHARLRPRPRHRALRAVGGRDRHPNRRGACRRRRGEAHARPYAWLDLRRSARSRTASLPTST